MNIVDDIGLITVFLLILLAVFLLTAATKNKRPNTFFALFLIVTSLDIAALFLDDLYKEYAQLNYLRVTSVFLQMPLFYFYVKAICYHNFKVGIKQVIHAIPFLGFLILFSTAGISKQGFLLYEILTQIQYYIYIVSIFYTLRKYRQQHLENYSLQNKTYLWLMTTSILFLIGNSFVVLRTIARNFYEYQEYPLLNLGISLFGLAVICWFVIKTMRNPDLFSNVNQDLKPLGKKVVQEKEKYQAEIASICDYMVTNKPYLEEALTLHHLSQKINIPEKQLSFLINKVLGKHFFDFINDYRIQEAKLLLENKDLNIQQIMYDVGFNSKSSFNTAFKKYTALTPSKYRKSVH